MKMLKKIITKKFINHLAFISNLAVFISSFFFQNYICGDSIFDFSINYYRM